MPAVPLVPMGVLFDDERTPKGGQPITLVAAQKIDLIPGLVEVVAVGEIWSATLSCN